MKGIVPLRGDESACATVGLGVLQLASLRALVELGPFPQDREGSRPNWFLVSGRTTYTRKVLKKLVGRGLAERVGGYYRATDLGRDQLELAEAYRQLGVGCAFSSTRVFVGDVEVGRFAGTGTLQVGRAEVGPNKPPTRLSSPREFLRVFGSPGAENGKER